MENSSFLFFVNQIVQMFKTRILLLVAVSTSLLISGCDTGITGSENENQLPSTFLTVKEINRSDDARLSSQINISWWGDDPDGYIEGYEFAINDTSEGAWTYTEKTDSLFVLPITRGQSADDVLFKVRAVDNSGGVDPKGARVVFPIKNTPPTVQVVPTESAPDTTYSIVSFGWVIDDPDGFINIERTEVAFNDTSAGSWTPIPFGDDEQVFISLEIEGSSAEIFQGRSLQATGLTIDGINQNGDNTFYVRTIDQAGASSEIDTVSWYVKEQQSNILFLNDVDLVNNAEIVAFHKSQMASVGLNNLDTWIINDGEFGSGRKVPLSDAFPSVIDPILQKTLAQWDHIYWVSNDLDRNITYAQEILVDFFDNGGTVFFNIPTKGLSNSDPLFDFLPIERLASFSGLQTGPFIRSGSPISPIDNPNLPVLEVTQNNTNVYPFEVASGTTPLYSAEVRATLVTGGSQEYDGPNTVALQNPEGNVVFFGIELRQINGNDNVDELLDYILNEELCFDGSCQ